MSDMCCSQGLWRDVYNRQFPVSIFKVRPHADVNWIRRYHCRSAIARNIKLYKPKVQSFKSTIQKLKPHKNSFAYSTGSSINLVIYDYLDDKCEYIPYREFKVNNYDFVFMDDHSIMSVDSDNVTLIDIETGKETTFNVSVGLAPTIEPIASNLFAVVSNGECFIYDTREGCDKKCAFQHSDSVLSTAHTGTTLYIASNTDVTAHDVRNPRGPIIWNYAAHDSIDFASFNVKAGHALAGTTVISMLDGRPIVDAEIQECVCGSLLNSEVAILGCKHRSVVFFDYKNNEIFSTEQFGEDEGIRHIAAGYNGCVAVAGEYTVRLYSVAKEEDEWSAESVKILSGGSIACRKLGKVPYVKEIVFDGERCLTNNETFVRVYDFYTGKA